MKKFVNNNLYLFSLFFPLPFPLLRHPRALFLLRHPRVFFYYVILYYLSSSSGLTRGSIPYHFFWILGTHPRMTKHFTLMSSSGLTRGSIPYYFFGFSEHVRE